MHSLLGPLVLAVTAPRRAARRRVLAGAWAAHLALDYLTHHDDAWPPAWPLASWRWAAPVSYWQPEHHARAWSRAESAVLLGAVLVERGAARRAIAGVALLAVAGPALGHSGPTLWHALGARPDPEARARDLRR